MGGSGVRVVYFGNSRTAFSNRHFEALTQSSAQVVAFVDSPAASISTDRRTALDSPILDSVAGQGIRYFRPEDVNDPAVCRQLSPAGARPVHSGRIYAKVGTVTTRGAQGWRGKFSRVAPAHLSRIASGFLGSLLWRAGFRSHCSSS